MQADDPGRYRFVTRWRLRARCEDAVATGDLEGEGHWTLRQEGDATAVTYEWTVSANHAFIRRFSWLLRPLFAANHNWTMAQGLRGLRNELATRASMR